MRLMQREVRRRHPLRRPLRPVDRRAQGRGRRAGCRDWFFFVNGVESEVGAAEYELSPGDRVQWDYRDWDTAMRVPGDRRRVPRAVPERDRRPAPARCGSSATTPSPTPAGPPRTRSTASRCRCRGRRSGAPGTEQRDAAGGRRAGRAARIVRGGFTLEEGPERAACSPASPRTAARSTCSTTTATSPAPSAPATAPALVAALRPRADELRLARDGARRRRAGGGGARPARERPARRLRGRGDRAVRWRSFRWRAMTLIPAYRSRPSALHAARASVGAAFCCAFALVGALYRNPLSWPARSAAILARRRRRRGGREVGRSLRLALPFALLVALVNALVYQEGRDPAAARRRASSAGAGTSRSRRPSKG